jgi:Protein kinase domain
MGTVWRGSDVTTGVWWAIKLLRPEYAANPETVARFVGERTALIRLRHTNLVWLRDMIVEDDRMALVMELTLGGDLEIFRKARGGSLAPGLAAGIGAQISAGLAAAHAVGIVHSYLKPSNVLMDRGQVKLADFGLARIVGDAGRTTSAEVTGATAYMAPEMSSGAEPSGAADVYALGIILYELLTGSVPFGGTAAEVMQAHLRQVPPRPPVVPDGLWDLISACLRKDPKTRPGAAELAMALAPLVTALGPFAAAQDSVETPVDLAAAQPDPVAAPVGPVAAPVGPVAASAGPVMSGPPSTAGPAARPENMVVGAEAAVDRPGSTVGELGGLLGGPGGKFGPREGSAGAPEGSATISAYIPDQNTSISELLGPEYAGHDTSGGGSWRRSRRVPWAAAAGAVVLAGAGITVAMLYHSGSSGARLDAAGTPAGSLAASRTTLPGQIVVPTGDPGSSHGTRRRAKSEASASSSPSSQANPSPSQSPRPKHRASHASADAAWQCGQIEQATLWKTNAPTGQTMQACIRVSGGYLDLKGTMYNITNPWTVQIALVLKDPNQQDAASYESPACTTSTCTFSVQIKPSAGSWTVLPKWYRNNEYEAAGQEPAFVSYPG